MREPAEREIQKNIVLEKCFNCLVEKGIESITTRDLTKATGLKSSSLYYWFQDKDEIILDATNFGINYVVDNIFDYAMHHLDNIPKFVEDFPEFAQGYKTQLKTIIQVTTSRKYGEHIKDHFSFTGELYDRCAEKLSFILGIEYKKVRILVDLFVSTMIDYVIWDEKEKFIDELSFIFSFFENVKPVDKEK